MLKVHVKVVGGEGYFPPCLYWLLAVIGVCELSYRCPIFPASVLAVLNLAAIICYSGFT